jgi:hypothetical protein
MQSQCHSLRKQKKYNPKIHMDSQKTLNRHNNLEEKESNAGDTSV